MTREQINDLPGLPRFFGGLMYANGMAVPLENIQWTDGQTLKEKWMRRLHHKLTQLPVNKEDERLLVNWVIYYLNAPIWLSNPFGGAFMIDELLESITEDIDLDELISRCLDIGIDPL